MHTLLEYDGKLPVYVNITKGSVLITRERKTFLWKRSSHCLDRFTTIFQCSIWDSKGVFFVIRHFTGTRTSTKRSSKHPKRRRNSTSNPFPKKKYPKIKKSGHWDDENNKLLK